MSLPAGPQSLTIAVAGDVRPEQVRRLAERYFGPWHPAPGLQAPSSCGGAGGEEPLPLPATPREDWRYQAVSRAGPAVMHAYYRPCIRSPDALPLDLASDLLSGTRSSRLYRNLVLKEKALSASAYSTYPAEKHPSQFYVVAVPSKGRCGGAGVVGVAAAAAVGNGHGHAASPSPFTLASASVPCCPLSISPLSQPFLGSSLDKLDQQLSTEVAALAGEGPTADELRRYKKVRGRSVGLVYRTGRSGTSMGMRCGSVFPISSPLPVAFSPHSPSQSARMELLDALSSNTAIAAALASYQVRRWAALP